MPDQTHPAANESRPEPGRGAPLAEPPPNDEDTRIAPASLAWFLGSVLLVILTLVIYTPTIRDGWTRYDNMLLIARQPLVQDLSLDGVKRMFTSYHHDLYQPLLTLSLAIDYRLNQREPTDHQDAHWPATDLARWHLHSLAVHLLVMVLLFLLIGRLVGNVWAAWLGTALVALHPLLVEPVNWLICRTFLLTGFWIVLGCHLYLSYARRPRWWLYLLAFGCFGLSMLAKLFVGLFLLPLLFDLWCRRRRWGLILVEKLPLLLLVGVLFYVNKRHIFGPTFAGMLPERTFGQMMLWGFQGLCLTAEHILFPANLTIFYGASEEPWFHFLSAAAPALMLATVAWIVALVVLFRRRAQLFLCLSAWVVLFFPLMAAIRLRDTVTSDRYNYVPLWMLGLGLAWLLSRWFGSPDPTASPKLRNATIGTKRSSGYLALVAGLALCAWLTAQSRAQTKLWLDDAALWQAAAEHTPHYVAYGQWGNALITQTATLRKPGHPEQIDAKLTRAEEAFEAGLQLSPDHPLLLGNLGQLCLIRANDLRREVQTERQAGDDAGAAENLTKERQRLEQARALLQQAVENAPSLPASWKNLGIVSIRLGQLDQAKAALGKALELAPADASARRHLAGVLRQIRISKEAEVARSPDPQNTEALRLALSEEADLLERLGRHDEAAQLRTQAAPQAPAAGEPDDPVLLNDRGAAALKAAQAQGKRMRSLLAPSRLRRASPEQQQQRRAAADQARQELINHGRTAESNYRKLIGLNESSSPAWRGLAQALLYQGRNDEADQAFAHAIELDPTNVEALAGRARLLATTGKMDQAIALLDQALQVKPDLEAALFDLFNIRYSQKRLPEATQAMEKLHQYYPDNNTYRQLLRQLYEAQGRASDAARLTQPDN